MINRGNDKYILNVLFQFLTTDCICNCIKSHCIQFKDLIIRSFRRWDSIWWLLFHFINQRNLIRNNWKGSCQSNMVIECTKINLHMTLWWRLDRNLFRFFLLLFTFCYCIEWRDEVVLTGVLWKDRWIVLEKNSWTHCRGIKILNEKIRAIKMNQFLYNNGLRREENW